MFFAQFPILLVARSSENLAAEGFFVLLLLAAAAKCFQSIRRRQVEKLSGASLLTALLSWGAILQHDRAEWLAILGLAVLFLSATLAVLGLIAIRKARSESLGGRKHAWLALVLTVPLMLVAAGSSYEGLKGTDASPTEVADAETEVKTVRFPELHFEYTPTVDGLGRIEPVTDLNPDAALGYTRSGSRGAFVIIAEDASGQGVEFGAAALATLVRANLDGAVEGLRVLRQEPRVLGDLDGVWIASEGTVAGKVVRFIHFAMVRQHHAYQLMATAVRDQERPLEETEREAAAIFGGFRFLDFEAAASLVSETASGSLASLEDSRWGFVVDLEGLAAGPWEERAANFPDTVAGALAAGGRAGVVVASLLLQDHEVPLETAARELSRRVAVPFDEGRLVDSAAGEGLTLISKDEEWAYRVRVLKREGVAHALAAWIRLEEEDADEVLTEICSRFSLSSDWSPLEVELLTEGERATQASMHGALGNHAMRGRDLRRAEGHFRSAVDFEPGNPDRVGSLVGSMHQQGRHEAALQELRRRLPDASEDLALRSWEPFLLARLDLAEEAIALYQSVFDEGWDDPADLEDFASLLERAGKVERALLVVDAFAKRAPDAKVEGLKASLLQAAGRHDEAIEVLVAARDERPLDDDLALDLAYSRLRGEEPAAALAICDEIRERDRETADWLKVRAEALLELRRPGEAKKVLSGLMRTEAEDVTARRLMARASNLLGQGENYHLAVEIPPVEVPENVLSSVTAPFVPGAVGVFYERRLTAIEFERGVDYRRTELRRIRVLDAVGASDFSTLEWSFDPTQEEIHVNRLRVLDAQGGLVSEGKLDDYYVLDDPSESVASGEKKLILPVTGVAAGTTIVSVVTWRPLSSPGKLPYFKRYLTTSYSAPRAALFLRGDVDAIRAHARFVAPAERGTDYLLWKAEDPTPFVDEPFSDRLDAIAPSLLVASAEDEWVSLAKDYLSDLEPRLGRDAATEALARELAEGGVGAPADLGVRAAREVQARLNYHAVAFGHRAWLPDPAAEVLSQRLGDCKGHALVLWKLLRALEIPAHLALVSFGDEVVAEVPSMAQFDHMIVYLPRGGEGQFFDTTDKDYDLAHLPPLGLLGTWALVLDPERPRLERVGQVAVEQSVIASQRRIGLSLDGEQQVEETVELRGPYAASWREMFRGRSEDEQLQYLQWLVDDGTKGARLKSADFEGLDEPLSRLTVRLRYAVPGSTPLEPGRWTLRSPATIERHFLETRPVPGRKTPFRFWSPVRFEGIVTVEPPEGWGLALPSSNASGSGHLLDWEVAVEQDEGVVRYRTRLARARGTGSPDQFAVYEASVRDALETFEPSLELRSSRSRLARGRPSVRSY